MWSGQICSNCMMLSMPQRIKADLKVRSPTQYKHGVTNMWQVSVHLFTYCSLKMSPFHICWCNTIWVNIFPLTDHFKQPFFFFFAGFPFHWLHEWSKQCEALPHIHLQPGKQIITACKLPHQQDTQRKPVLTLHISVDRESAPKKKKRKKKEGEKNKEKESSRWHLLQSRAGQKLPWPTKSNRLMFEHVTNTL